MNRFKFNITSYRVGGDHSEFAVICRESGAAGVEFWPWTLEDDLSAAEITAIGDTYRKEGIVPDTYHLPFWFMANPSTPCEDDRRKGVDNLCEYIDKTADLGVRAVILHPGGASVNNTPEEQTLRLKSLSRSLDQMLPAAEKARVQIALENMLPKRGNCLAASPEHIKLLRETFTHPLLGFCLDTGHAAISGGIDGARDMLEAMGDRIIAFHLQDNTGNIDMHLAPGKGLFDWNSFFKRVGTLDFPGHMTIEAPPFAVGPPFPIKAWKRLVADTKLLANAANLSISRIENAALSDNLV